MIKQLLDKYSNSGVNIIIPNNNSDRNGKGSFYIQFGFNPIDYRKTYLVYQKPKSKTQTNSKKEFIKGNTFSRS